MKDKLKIIHVLLSKGFAGTERSTAESCNAQCEKHEVVLVCSTKNTRSSGATILKHIDPRVKIIKISSRFFVKKNLQKIIDTEQPDVVHAHLRKPTRALSKCLTDAVKISTLHIGVNSPHFLNMDGLIAISPWQLKHVPKSYDGQLSWIRNSLTPHPKPSKERIEELREEMGANASTFVVGGIGRLSHSKGWDTLIKAFEHANLDNSKLVLIGEGRDKEKLQNLATHKNIVFLGYKHQIKDYYSAFDVFVCPSREEPMGRVILEAMDAGTPVVASDIEGPGDILREFPGELFPVSDHHHLSQILKRLESKSTETSQPTEIDLSAHHIENVTKEMLAFYQKSKR